jgi:DNA invertase Pin-like site-specific DNA recombinase
MIVGYARVSTIDQNLDIQEDKLRKAGAEKLFSEKMSGTQAGKRDRLQDCLEFVREGDVLLVTRLDRIARSSVDLHNIIAMLEAKGVGFRTTDQAGVDTTSSQGKLLIGMLGAVAEFENNLRRERQRDGIDAAKARGAYKGGKARIDRERVREMLSRGESPSAIARALGINRASVYRLA